VLHCAATFVVHYLCSLVAEFWYKKKSERWGAFSGSISTGQGFTPAATADATQQTMMKLSQSSSRAGTVVHISSTQCKFHVFHPCIRALHLIEAIIFALLYS
jgi:hypothetical protein